MTDDDKACSLKYMKTKSEYNSSVYDLVANYDDVPSNLPLPTSEDISKLLKTTLPACKKGYFKLKSEKTTPENKTLITNDYNLYLENVQYILKPADLINLTNSIMDNNGNLINNTNFNCNPRTPLILIGDETSGAITRIVIYGKNLKYSIYNFKNQLIKSDYETSINLSKNKENNIYLIFDLKKDSYFTRMELYSNKIMEIAKI